jgi:hypothetical protein
MTWIPFSYCCFVGAVPTEAKWPFIVITEEAVGCLEAADGLREEWPFVSGDDGDMVGSKLGLWRN